MTAVLLLALSLPILGQGAWCVVPPGAQVLFCDYVDVTGCVAANHDAIAAGGVCVVRPVPPDIERR
jgi:hypothetical protein